MPNLWVALTGVAATAVLAHRLMTGEGRYDELLAGGLVAVTALLRPLDAVVLAAALILLPIAVRRATIAWTVHIVLGLVAVDALARGDSSVVSVRPPRPSRPQLSSATPASGPCSRTSVNTSP